MSNFKTRTRTIGVDKEFLCEKMVINFKVALERLTLSTLYCEPNLLLLSL